jgi:Grap2 and cyclin-D-interacting
MSGLESGSHSLAITTTIALTEQFLTSLSPTASVRGTPTVDGDSAPSPLALLNASAKTLKAQVTKLSLLTVTAPFTLAAVAACLKPLNDSILPSLTTATLLTTAELFISSFASECRDLSQATLHELLGLVKLVEERSIDAQRSREISESAKKNVTEATGRVWECCDKLDNFSAGGLRSFVVHKCRQWLDLMKDAVKELTEWDPNDDIDDDDIFGCSQSDDDTTSTSGHEDGEKSTDRAIISAGVRDQVLKVLTRIPQSVHVVIKQRLDKLPSSVSNSPSMDTKNRLGETIRRIKNVSELIDEAAEAMYMGDPELCLKKAGEARAETLEIVQSALQPFEESAIASSQVESQENKYLQRALDWIRQVEATKLEQQP